MFAVFYSTPLFGWLLFFPATLLDFFLCLMMFIRLSMLGLVCLGCLGELFLRLQAFFVYGPSHKP